MSDKHILATSTGFKIENGLLTLGPIIRYGLELTGKETPKLCYIGTAGGDDPSWIARFYTACQNEKVKSTHLQLFMQPNVADIRAHLLNQDMIWVSGGSVANLLAIWRLHGLDEIMREAWDRGIILAGVSAGSICWHVGGTTDSFGAELQPITNGLGLLPYSNGVHYDSEERRRPLFQRLIAEGKLPEGYAADDGVGIHYIGGTLHKVVTDTPEKFAYHVIKTDDGVQETKLDAELLN